jgi:hypothetical protein
MQMRLDSLLPEIPIEIGGKICGCIDLDTPHGCHRAPRLRVSFGWRDNSKPGPNPPSFTAALREAKVLLGELA